MISPAILRQLEQQREEERERERIRRQFARAGRSSSKSGQQSGNGSSKGGSTFRMPPVRRARRAPASSSQYHFHAKKSKASGAGKAPVSCVNKIKYDLGLDQKDPHKDRVKMVFVSVPEGTSAPAKDPLKMAEACLNRARQSKYANSNTGQMLHFDTALPNVLADDRLAKLADQVNAKIGQKFGVPAYSGVHLDRGNYHIHSSVPLYEVHGDGRGGFYLGDRINHAKRPAEREALGLPKDPAGELRQLRQEVADLIAESVVEHYKGHPDPEQARHISERWRYGHLTLPQQVQKAASRGDVQFVLDNINREATRKEGPPTGAWRAAPADPRRDAAIAHNKIAGTPSEIPAPELITKTLVQRVVALAEQAKLDKPEELRMLAKKCGLNVHWSANKDGKVQGVSFSLDGGPRVAGGRVGASLGTLKKLLGWAEKPAYRRFPPKSEGVVMDFKQKLIEAKLEHVDCDDYVATSIRVTLFRLKKIEDEARKNAPPAAGGPLAEPAKPEPAKRAVLESPEAKTPIKKARPKRRSNDPGYHVRHKGSSPEAPSARAPAVLSANDKKQPAHGAGQGYNPQKQVIRPVRPVTAAQKALLARAWDDQQAEVLGSFVGPLCEAEERLDAARTSLAKHMKAEPWPSQERRRGLFGSRMVETNEHKEWNESREKQLQRVEQLEQKIGKMVEQACADPKLLATLPKLESDAARRLELRQARAREEAHRQYEKALEMLNMARPGSHQLQRAYSTIQSAIQADPELADRERERRIEQARQNVSRGPTLGGTVGTIQRERSR